MDCTHQAPLSMGFSRQKYRNGLPCTSPRDLLDPGIEPASLVSPALAGGFFTTAPPEKLDKYEDLTFCYPENSLFWITPIAKVSISMKSHWLRFYICVCKCMCSYLIEEGGEREGKRSREVIYPKSLFLVFPQSPQKYVLNLKGSTLHLNSMMNFFKKLYVIPFS